MTATAVVAFSMAMLVLALVAAFVIRDGIATILAPLF